MRAALIGAGPKRQMAIKRGEQRQEQLGVVVAVAVHEEETDWQPAATLA